jgi:hypothetical protein
MRLKTTTKFQDMPPTQCPRKKAQQPEINIISIFNRIEACKFFQQNDRRLQKATDIMAGKFRIPKQLLLEHI